MQELSPARVTLTKLQSESHLRLLWDRMTSVTISYLLLLSMFGLIHISPAPLTDFEWFFSVVISSIIVLLVLKFYPVHSWNRLMIAKRCDLNCRQFLTYFQGYTYIWDFYSERLITYILAQFSTKVFRNEFIYIIISAVFKLIRNSPS